MNPSLSAVALALGAALGAAPATAAPPRATTPEDLARIAYVSSATISHHGDHVAFVVSRLDVPQNRYRRDIWIVRSDGTGLRRLTAGDGDTDPQWSPDDRAIAFSGARGGTSQIYRIAIDGGEAQRLTHEANGASGARWSHDGTRILYSATFVDPKPKTDLDQQAAGGRLDAAHEHSDIRRTNRLDFELNGEGETFTRHAHLLVIRADGTHRTQITPTTSWSESQPAWSYDDRSIAFVSLRRPADPERIDSDVYVVPSGGGVLRRVATRHRASSSPVWAHDSRHLYLSVSSLPDPAAMTGIVEQAVTATNERTVVPENRVQFGDAVLTDMREGGAGCGPLLDPHDRWFLADVSVPGATQLVRYDAASGRATPLIARGDEIAECSMDQAGTRVAYVASDATHPAELYVADVRGGGSRRITNLNAAYLASVRIAPAQPFVVHDDAGFPIHAWFVPAAVPRGTRAPTLLEIHGGPGAEFGNSFFHEVQMLAGRGYNVVLADPRGSIGFGYAFSAALAKNWGDPMFRDEMAVMDVIARRRDVDPGRLGVLGGSYGGYATLWVIGHSHRFKAALAERVVSNMTSSFLACDECSSISAKYSFGNAWDHQAAYWATSPIASIANVTTPLLLLHSDDDTRTPLVDADQWFTLAKALHEPITYVQVPRENHDLNRTGEPIHRVERLHLIENWFAKELR